MRIVIVFFFGTLVAAVEGGEPLLVDLAKQFPQKLAVGQVADRPVAIFLGAGSGARALYVLPPGVAWSPVRTPHYNVLDLAGHQVEGMTVLETMPVPKDRRVDFSARERVYWIRLADGINMLCVNGKWEVYVDQEKLARWPVPETGEQP